MKIYLNRVNLSLLLSTQSIHPADSLAQHLHACKNNCDVFYGREEELERIHQYIVGPSQKPFVLYGAAGAGKSALLRYQGYIREVLPQVGPAQLRCLPVPQEVAGARRAPPYG